MKAFTRNLFTGGMGLLAAAALATTAAAVTVTSHDPGSITAALQNAGYKAKLGKDKDGAPQIETAANGADIIIFFSGCTDGKTCDNVEFLALWDCSDSVKRCEALSQTWNTEENFSNAVIAEKNIVLYRHLLFDKVGISDTLFIRNFSLFSDDAAMLMSKF